MGGTTGVMDLGVVTPGAHDLIVKGQVTGFLCDTVLWSGTLSVPKPGVAADDDVLVPQGGAGSASTAVTGSPRPAGIAATLFHYGAAANVARLSVATYEGAPTGAADSLPIRASAYLDLRLENGDPADTIAAEFLPPSPILPPNPVLPPNPIVPPNPILPPNPIRLAYWTGNSWGQVRDSGGLRTSSRSPSTRRAHRQSQRYGYGVRDHPELLPRLRHSARVHAMNIAKRGAQSPSSGSYSMRSSSPSRTTGPRWSGSVPS
jgi:hypothetical protein